MKGGELQVKQRVREVVRYASVLVPSALVLYEWLAKLDFGGNMRADYVFSAIMIPWLTLSLVIFVTSSKKRKEAFLRLGAYHLCAGAYVLLISGLHTPFVPLAWVLLLLISYIYLSRYGILMNLAILFGVTLVDIMLNSDNSALIVIDLVSISSIFLIGAIIILLNRIQRIDSEELNRSKAQELLQNGRMNTLINNLADAVININEDGKVELYNAASLNLLDTNISLHKQIVDDAIKVKGPNGRRVKLLTMAKKARGVSKRDDLTLDIGDETIRLEVTVSPVRSSYSRSRGESSTDGYILILRDITKAKSLEEERDEFISVVSHELRTPITVVEGTLSNIQLMIGKGKTSSKSLANSLDEAHNQIMFLSRMVNDLSTLSRAERGVADDIEEINTKQLVEQLFNEYSPQAEKKKLRFDIDMSGDLGTISTSRLYLHELLQNMITNAIKYTKEGSITLKATRKGDNVLFEVKDTGIGISKTDQDKIFHKFYRSEDYRTRETGGTGLGLYVASKLAKKLGTTIEIKSRLNYGSTFSFLMPVSGDKENRK